MGAIGPGATGITTLKMTAGDYLLVCFMLNAEGVPHMAFGMIKPITVIESSAPVAALPEAKVSIDMVDFGFGFSGAISAGPQNISVTNKGEEEHEAFLIRLAQNATATDFVGAVALDAPLDLLPLKLWLVSCPLPQGVAVHSTSMLLLADMRSYVSWKPGQRSPHLALGMLVEFSIQ